MKLARTGIIAAAVLAVASVTFAQKPDFSGTWTVDTSAAPAPTTGGEAGGGRRGGMGGPMTVKMAADTLTVERSMGENTVSTIYKLDGTESVNKMMGQGGTEVEVKSTAKWDGSKLTIMEKRPAPDGTVRETTQVWSLEGGNLVIESTNARGTQKRTYKKTT